ncbi:hypothetical protein [Streptococcus constellatus]|jgi:hypothetical protein|uniref:hypothetical protein n=1 Tax=Streptococcus constellatus TaxID=76860 RepID=UPI0020018AAC|nr:hypothetical protein [Streptococcus constellatus]UTX64433.1 hypothetical protein DEH83_03530 [Streptococcus constellatus]CAJ1874915.1 hypothetical protein AUSP0061_00055 [uncultured phage]
MTLEIVKTRKLVGNIKIDDTLVKTMTADIDEKGITSFSEWINNTELYSKNRREIRKQEAEFQNKIYEVEDAIISELESGNKEK